MKKSYRDILLGAAFLMATSAIGPGFLTQTTVFTQKLASSFGFAILISIIMDLAAQLNIWRVVAVSERRAQDVANLVFPGMGYVLAILILFGGIAFNIGNIAGAGMGFNVLFGFDIITGAVLSAVLAIGIFLIKQAGTAMDYFTKVLGFLMIGLTLYVAWTSKPPLALALKQSVFPEKVDLQAILTIVGGTVGGYITFAGAHRLIDAGIKGQVHLQDVSKSACMAIGLASLMRILLFLAALGVVVAGHSLAADNPTASVFRVASGETGYRLFGMVLWSASITSVVGSAYTSVSFIKSFSPLVLRYERFITIAFIIFSTGIFIAIGQPVKMLILAGALNGLILPFALTLMLIAAHKKSVVSNYKHPLWMTIVGVMVIITMTYIGIEAMKISFKKF